MENLPQRVTDGPSALARVGMYLLIPVVGLLLLPVLLFFIIALYLLAVVQGARVFVFSSRTTEESHEHELQEPHFVQVKVRQKSLTDESTPPTGV